MMTKDLPIKLGVLYTAFSSVPTDHYNQETGCFVLSLSTEIGRLVALSEGVSSPEARESLGRTTLILEGLLTLEASKLGLRQLPSDTVATERPKVHRAKHYPLRPNIEVHPTHAERAEVRRVGDGPVRNHAGLPQRGARVLYQVTSCRGMQEPRPGLVLGFKETRRGVWVQVKDKATKRLVMARQGLVRNLGDGS